MKKKELVAGRRYVIKPNSYSDPLLATFTGLFIRRSEWGRDSVDPTGATARFDRAARLDGKADSFSASIEVIPKFVVAEWTPEWQARYDADEEAFAIAIEARHELARRAQARFDAALKTLGGEGDTIIGPWYVHYNPEAEKVTMPLGLFEQLARMADEEVEYGDRDEYAEASLAREISAAEALRHDATADSPG